jgi:hypothetical protein
VAGGMQAVHDMRGDLDLVFDQQYAHGLEV